MKNSQAKARIIKLLTDIYEEKAYGGNVAGQQTAIYANQLSELFQERLTVVQAYKLEKRVAEAEYYDPKKDKWGFGPTKVYPTDYIGFARELFPETFPMYK